MGLFRKQEKVEQMLDRYFALCDRCFESFEQALDLFFDEGVCDEFIAAVDATHRAESEADDMRRDIELTLYGKALLPESRGDILGLLETFDGLPNIAETVGFVLTYQGSAMPEELKGEYRKLVDVNIEGYRLARKAADQLMNNPKVVLGTTKEVDQKESASDTLERALIRKIFELDVTDGTKLMLKEIVLLTGDITDRAQRVADRIGLVAIKRQI